MKHHVNQIILALMTSTLIAGCSLADEDPADPAEAQTGSLNLNVDIVGDSDVVGFQFDVERVYCPYESGPAGDPYVPAETYQATESLEELTLPGGSSRYVQAVYDTDSQHLFSDSLFNVSVGCYDVTATPLRQAAGQLAASDDCSPARVEGVYAAIDAANEVQLISQCEGAARTTLDILASLNHPPEVDVELQKFACAGTGVRVCATATDPDGDPVDFEWTMLQPDPNLAAIPEGPPVRAPDGSYTQCAMVPTSPTTSSHEYRVIARDYGWDAGQMLPIEDIITQNQVDPVESQASMTFAVHGLDQCIPGAMSFFGMTMGADLSPGPPYNPDPARGMTRLQAKTLANNAVNWVNPNLLGDPDPRILIVLDNNNQGEDTLDAPYIEALLSEMGFTQVDRIVEPAGGLLPADLVGYKVVWMVNPGFPPDSDNSRDALENFRLNGGGLIVSGDDMVQSQELSPSNQNNPFSFLNFLGDNGTSACGESTDNWAGSDYLVEFAATSTHPLLDGLAGQSFPYGNDLDDVAPKGLGESVLATTSGLTTAGKETCLPSVRPVITAVAEGITVD